MKLRNIITLKSKYKAKTKFEFWNNLEIGDVVEISLKLEPIRSRRGGLYATNIVCSAKGKTFTDSITMICKYLSNIDYEERG